jgi:hypothetical protein
MPDYFTGSDSFSSRNESTELGSNPDPEKIRQEKDFIIKSIILQSYNGKEYDVNWLRTDLVIKESVFQSFITGSITLRDAVDLPQLFPIIGEEKLKIVFTRPSVDNEELPDYTAEFRVYKMSGQTLSADRRQTYTLHFISEEAIKNLKYGVRRSFSGLQFSEMVIKVFEKYLSGRKSLKIESTKGKHKFVIPGYSPIEFFNTAAVMSVSNSNNGANYFFWEDKDQFNFKSLGELFKQEKKETYLYAPANILNSKDVIIKDRDIEKDIRTAETYTVSNTFNILENIMQGMYSSDLMGIDLVRKRAVVHEFNYKESFEEFPHIEKHDICSDESDAIDAGAGKLVPTNEGHDIVSWISSREPGILPTKVEKWLQKRMTQILQIQNTIVSTEVSGDPRRKCGDIIEFLIPSQIGNVSEEQKQEENKYLTGKYFVSTVVHRLSGAQYTMSLDLIKDSYFSEIEHTDIKEILDPIW